MERSPSPRQRPSSPDVVCPICLGEITNKAVTDSCLHSFCFSCLSEWSKVKPECPLCKQKFSIIYHTIKSMGDYQEYRIDAPLDLARAPHGLVAGIDPFDPHIFINVAVQRATRFGYRTTMGVNRNGRAPVMFWMPPEEVSQRRRVPQILRSSPHSSTAFAATSGSASRSASTSRPTRTSATSVEFRRNVYQQNLWVRAAEGDRVRESNPEFYRDNPAQTHRLVPWLTRELSVLLDVTTTPYYHEHACREILGWITMYPINSYDFKRLVQTYFGGKTDHFVHEFYHFAISPFDLPAYDNHSRYTTSNAELETVTPTDELILENLANDSNFDPVQFRRPDVHNLFGYGFPVPRRPFGTLTLVPPAPRGPPDVIVVSSDEEPPAPESDNSDSEVMIIGSLPPMHLRVPEVITLDDSGDDSDVIEIKPATPPLIEIADGSDSQSHSPSLPSTSNGIAGTSSSQPDAPMNHKRTARFFRPSYREYSSSSEEDFVSKKKSPKKKISEKKRPSRSSSKRFKSSKYVDSSSSDSEGSDELEKEESGNDQRASRRKRQRSSDDDSRPESSRDRSNDLYKLETRRRSSMDTKSSKKTASSSSGPSCPKCLTPNMIQVPVKKRSHSISSDSSGGRYSRPKQRNKRFAYGNEESRSSTMSLDVETDFNPSQEPTTSLAPNPKAMSKKAIILNKRKSEMSFDQLEAGPSKTSSSSDARKVKQQLLSSDTDQNDSMDNKESIGPYECPKMSDSPSISYSKIRPEKDIARQLPGMSVYSSDTSSSILSMGQEYMPGLDAGGSNGHSSSNLLPQSHNGNHGELSGGNHRSDWDQIDVPARPPSICSTSSSSSSSSSDSVSSSHSILNVTSVDPPPLDQTDDSYPDLTLNPAASVLSEGEDLSAVASSPPNLRRFDDASSPFISLNHSPLQSDSSSPPSPSHTSVTSPPRLKSIVLRVPTYASSTPSLPFHLLKL
uniref:E3 ubiquitin-protein ligase Topors n=1 Tax=Lygus hesperus TaxID=30085 RepID=A0A0A9YTS8_LYGHE